jgi:TP901 family phage tail tape measure protein
MSLDLGSLLFRLGAETSGLRRAQGEMGAFRSGVTQTTASVARFLNVSELKAADEGVKRLVGLRGEFNRLAGQVDPTIAAMNRYKKIQDVTSRAIRTGAITQREANRVLGLARERWGLATVKANRFTLAMQDLTKSVQIALGPLSGVAARITAFTGLLNLATAQVAIFVGGLIALGAGLIKSTASAKAFEDALVGVGKTTDLSGKALENFGQNAIQLAINLKAPITEVLNVAEAAGQLGISGSANLLKFTDTVIKLGTATDLVGQEGAKQLARLINVTTTSIDEIDTLGAVLVDLGNNSAATEREINKIAVEVGQATSQFKISAFSAEAFGAALASIGARAELSGSVIGRAFRAIDKSIREGGRAARNLSTLTGIALDDLKQAFEQDAAGVFRKFIEGLGRLDTETMSVTQALELFGLKGEEVNKILPSLVVNSELLTKAFNIMDRQIADSTALEEEFSKKSKTLTKELDQFKTLISAIATSIGGDFLPNVTEFVRSMNELLMNTREVATALEALASIFLGLLTVRLVTKAFSSLRGSFTSAAKVAGVATASFSGLLRILLRLAGPVGIGVSLGLVMFDLWKRTEAAADSAESYSRALMGINAALSTQDALNKSVAVSSKLVAQEQINRARVDILIEILDLQKKLAEAEAFLDPTKIVPPAAKESAKKAIADINKQILLLEASMANLDKATIRLQEKRGGVEDTGFIPEIVTLEQAEEREKARKAREANERLKETIELIRRETEAIKEGEAALAAFNREKDIEKQITQLVSKLRRLDGEEMEDFTARRIAFEKQVTDAVRSRAEAELEATRTETIADIEEQIVALGEEAVALGISKEAWQQLKAVRKIESQIEDFEETLEALGVEQSVIDDLIRKYRALALAKQRASDKTKALKKEEKELQKFVTALGSSFQSAFEDAIIGGESLRNILKGLIDDMIRLAIRMIVVKRLIDAIGKALLPNTGGGTSISGGEFASLPQVPLAKGGVLRAQKGTVISQPTMVAPGVVGGEAGIEGVFPLGRTPSGELGVKAVDKSAGMSVNFSVVVNDNSGNNNKFRVSKRKDDTGGLRAVINIVAKDIEEGGTVAKSLERNFGIRKTVALGRMI